MAKQSLARPLSVLLTRPLEQGQALARRLEERFGGQVEPILSPLMAPVFLAPPLLTGEFGAVIFIAGNQPMRTEIVALLTFIRLEEYDYPAAAAIATTMLAMAFVMLVVTNLIQGWHLRRLGHGET